MGVKFPNTRQLWPQSMGKKVAFGTVIALIAYFPLFLHLDVLPIQLWDESLFALRALHLYEEGTYMFNFNVYPDLPHHLNTKLPFTTFFQVLGYAVFGVNELGLRIPVVLIFLACTGYVTYFFRKEWSVPLVGIAFLLILIASPGIVQPHLLRTGDQDIPFSMYLLVALLFFHNYIQKNSSWALAGFTFFLLAALMTKNVLALLIGPACLIYALWERKLLTILKDGKLYTAILTFLAVCVGSLWYFESVQPGFLERMWNYELMGRYSETIEGHQGGIFFYLHKTIEYLLPYSVFLPVAIYPLFEQRLPQSFRSLCRLMLLAAICYLLVISFSQTKTTWYHAPVLIFVAMSLAMGGVSFFAARGLEISPAGRRWILGVLGLTFAVAYGWVVDSVYFPETGHKDEKYGKMIEYMEKAHPGMDTFEIVDNNFGTAAYFYVKKHSYLQPDREIHYRRHPHEVPDGTIVLTCLNNVMRGMREAGKVEMIEERGDCYIVRYHAQ